jgi:hypothetical protein
LEAFVRELRHDTKGAVYVEFLIAFLPLFVFFLSLCQLAYVQAAHVVVQHAAVMATRGAAVVLPDDPAFYDGEAVGTASGKRLDDIRRAAEIPLKAAVTGAPDFEITFPNGESVDRNGLVSVQVELDYPCKVPIGALIVCSPSNGRKKLTGISAFPNQGAGYEYAAGE